MCCFGIWWNVLKKDGKRQLSTISERAHKTASELPEHIITTHAHQYHLHLHYNSHWINQYIIKFFVSCTTTFQDMLHRILSGRILFLSPNQYCQRTNKTQWPHIQAVTPVFKTLPKLWMDTSSTEWLSVSHQCAIMQWLHPYVPAKYR